MTTRAKESKDLGPYRLPLKKAGIDFVLGPNDYVEATHPALETILSPRPVVPKSWKELVYPSPSA